MTTLPRWAPWLDDPAPPRPTPQPEDSEPETPAALRDRLLNEAHAAWEALNQEFMA